MADRYVLRIGEPVALGTISDLSATAGVESAVLTWTSAANATSHQPQYSDDGETWTNFGSALGGSATGVTVTGLTAGVAYSFRVVASDGVSTTTSNVDTATPTAAGTFAAADFEDGTIGDFTAGGSSTHRTLEIVADPTGGVGGLVAELGFDPGRGSDVDNYLARTFPYNGLSVGPGDSVYCYGRFYIVPNGYSGNRKLWRYYCGPQDPSRTSDITLWMSTTLRVEGPLSNNALFYENTGAAVSQDAWHELEVHIQMDSTPGAGDGQFRVWLDRVLVFENTAFGINSVTHPDLTIVRFGYQTTSTRPESGSLYDVRYWDDLAISTTRVAP